MGFGRYVFGILGNEAKIIIQYYLVPCRLSTDPKIYDLHFVCFVKKSNEENLQEISAQSFNSKPPKSTENVRTA